MKLTRRQALKMAGVATVGGLALPSVRRPFIVRAHEEEEEEPWEAFVEEELEIEMGSMYFQVKKPQEQPPNAPITLQVGKVYSLEFKNVDETIPHNALFGRDPDLEKRLYKTPLFEDLIGIELHGGEEGELFIRVPDKPGDWEMGCFVSGHYEAGMRATITIVQ